MKPIISPVEVCVEGSPIQYKEGPVFEKTSAFPYREISQLAMKLKTEKDLICAISRLIRETETVNHWGA